MRTKLSWVFGSVLMAAVAVVACSSDDDNKNNNGGGSGGSGGSGGQTADGGDHPHEDGGETTGACLSDSDKLAGKAGYCPDNKPASTVVKKCAVDCLLDSSATDKDACTRECVDEKTNNAFSAGCRDCYIALTTCGRENCTTPCLGTDEKACLACLCGDNKKKIDCYETFNECSGLGITYCQDLKDDKFEGYAPPDPAAQCDTDAGTDGGDEPDAE